MTTFFMRSILAFAAATLLMVNVSQAAGEIKPFILAYKASGDDSKILAEVKSKLTAAKFEIVGEYSPYDGANIVVITSDTLKSAAAKSEFGGYGAGQRVTVTKVGDEVQVSYTNPVYHEAAYRMGAEAELKKVADNLAAALGNEQQYGPKEGLTAKALKKYHYMFGMEYFDNPSELAEYDDYNKAVEAVVAGLQKGLGGSQKVYRIDIPGKEQTVFGVALKEYSEEKCHSDKFIMSEIDFKPIRSTGHLPYEILVDGGNVYALYARFRIAISFPDLAMMGENSFMNIMCAPNAIEDALTLAAGGEV